jgi:L-arabinokinase
VEIRDERWHGYLANIGRAAFEEYAAELPEAIQGEEFLARFDGTTDTVTRIDPDRRYAVRVPTAHPVFEHERVNEWASRLRGAVADSVDAVRLGALMYESHASYSACGLGSDGTDRLVTLARQFGPSRGIYGAKITGGGSGGTVALLASAAAGPIVREIAAQYESETGRAAYVFGGSSPGSARIGAVRLD